MRKIFSVLLVVLVFTAFQPIAFSQQPFNLITEEFLPGDKRTEVGANCSVFFPGTDKFKTGVYVGGIATYDVLRWFAIGAECGYLWTQLSGEGIDVGDLHSCLVLGDFVLKAPFDFYDFQIVPYAVAGLGGIFPEVCESSSVRNRGTIKTTAAFAMKFGGGLNIIFNEMLVINLEGSYGFSRIKFNEDLTGQTFGFDETIDVNCGYFGGGLRFRF